jgi:O-antigen ligase
VLGRRRGTCSQARRRAGSSPFASSPSSSAPKAVAAAAAFGAIVLLGARNGGFFADSWGWVALPLLLLAAGVLFTGRDVALTRPETLWLGAFALLTVWTALSALWAPTAGPPVTEADRALLYTAALVVVVLLGARGALPYAVLAAAFVLSVWSLVDKAHGGPTRLEGPIGYTNGLGLVAATGILLAVGLARRKPVLLATLAVFVPTLVFTYSRGSWLALAAGLLVLAALALRDRPRLLLALAVGAVVVIVLGLVLAGHSSTPNSGSGRLSSLSSNGRGDYWRAALAETRAHPLLGGGAGTWNRWWLLRRPNGNGALDAHSLYLETLAELGPLGLALLVAALALPLVSLRRALRHEWASACAAAYVALLVHAALDWDWELPAVALCGLFCGTALLGDGPRRAVPRVAGVAVTAAAAAAVFVLQVGNSALQSASNELDVGRVGAAGADARRAQRWQPWATEPQLLVGETQLAAGNVREAAHTFALVLRRDPGDADAWYQRALATTGIERSRARARAILLDPHGAARALK